LTLVVGCRRGAPVWVDHRQRFSEEDLRACGRRRRPSGVVIQRCDRRRRRDRLGGAARRRRVRHRRSRVRRPTSAASRCRGSRRSSWPARSPTSAASRCRGSRAGTAPCGSVLGTGLPGVPTALARDAATVYASILDEGTGAGAPARRVRRHDLARAVADRAPSSWPARSPTSAASSCRGSRAGTAPRGARSAPAYPECRPRSRVTPPRCTPASSTRAPVPALLLGAYDGTTWRAAPNAGLASVAYFNCNAIHAIDRAVTAVGSAELDDKSGCGALVYRASTGRFSALRRRRSRDRPVRPRRDPRCGLGRRRDRRGRRDGRDHAVGGVVRYVIAR